MTRSIWKGPPAFRLPTLEEWRQGKALILARGAMILPEFVGYNARVHNGKSFVLCKITENMIGRRFGEFALTRRSGYKKKKKK